jgi:hypothetical protein
MSYSMLLFVATLGAYAGLALLPGRGDPPKANPAVQVVLENEDVKQDGELES